MIHDTPQAQSWKYPQQWTTRKLATQEYVEWLEKDEWTMLALVPRGIVLQQEVAELVEKAVQKIEAKGHAPREDLWILWPWNYTQPTDFDKDEADGVHLKDRPYITTEEIKEYSDQEPLGILSILTGLSLIHRDHPSNVEVTRQRMRKRNAPHDEVCVFPRVTC
jgi:hypothetical protein